MTRVTPREHLPRIDALCLVAACFVPDAKDHRHRAK